MRLAVERTITPRQKCLLNREPWLIALGRLFGPPNTTVLAVKERVLSGRLNVVRQCRSCVHM